MIRFFGVHNTATEGTHTSVCWTSYRRTLEQGCEEMHARLKAGAVAKAPIFYDFGPGDADLRRLDTLPCWTGDLSAPVPA